jgi:adenylylsulfate kinase
MASPGDNNLTWHEHQVTKAERAKQKKQKPFLLWFTGLSGSGKSTLANALEYELFKMDHHSYILDGDNVRHGMNKDLGFSDEDRVENIRRIGEISKLFVDAGMIVISAFISPFRSERQMARDLLEDGEFIEVYVKAPLDICEERDPKGLYKKAREGAIKNFTGIDSPYEEPETAELTLDNATHTVEENVGKIVEYLKGRQLIL